MQPRGQRTHPIWLKLPYFQRHHHHMGTLPEKRLGPTFQYMGLEWPQPHVLSHEDGFSHMKMGLSISGPHKDSEVVAPSFVGLSPPAPRSSSTVPCLLNKREALTIAHGVDNLSDSLSLITFTIYPSVQVPITRGMCLENSDSSRTTRKTMSLS